MGKTQWIAVTATALLLLLTYWGCPVRPPEGGVDLTSAPTSTTGLESLIRAVRGDLAPAQIATLANLEERLALAETSETEPERPLLEQLAGEWFQAGHPAISGIYARKIAEASEVAEDWSIAATTFSLCLRRDGVDDKTRQFCSEQAVAAYQAAISLNPDDVDARINLALTYTDAPPQNEPMKGILMLRDLEKQYPENARVYITLAQLAIRTNQLDRAAQRLEKAVELEPENVDAICPLARVYEQLNQLEKAAGMIERCQQLINPPS
ncbi:MAG: tetratricopeptide repeat protein [Bacteroidota bacterium]